jgi:hypothetical protein
MKRKKTDPKDVLWDMCQAWIAEREITCAESVYQCDQIALDSLEFIESVCDIVGYAEFEEDEDE